MNRDPKVIWWEETNEWVIVLFLTDDRVVFFRSKDLKHWEQQSEFQSSGTIRDCPELFQLAVDGDEDNKKWILHGGYGQYFIGDFDGSKYTQDGEAIQFNYGNCFYAPHNFSDIPDDDGRRIQIAWGTNPSPGMPFNQMMNIPSVLTLHSTEDGLRMFANPVDEIENLYAEEHEWADMAIPADGGGSSLGLEGELFDFEVEFEVGEAEELGVVIRGQEVIYRVEDEQLVFDEERAPLKAVDGRISLRCIVDRTSIEIFANDGRVYMPCRLRAEDDDKSLALFARGGAAKATSIHVRELESIWE
jgi:sucrose-6-phosphate hydrolase SacC (GH32 family)